jgi:hypothetical protein
MASPLDKSVLLPPAPYNLLKQIAVAEERTLRATVERALKLYAAKHQPKLLKETGAAS